MKYTIITTCTALSFFTISCNEAQDLVDKAKKMGEEAAGEATQKMKDSAAEAIENSVLESVKEGLKTAKENSNLEAGKELLHSVKEDALKKAGQLQEHSPEMIEKGKQLAEDAAVNLSEFSQNPEIKQIGEIIKNSASRAAQEALQQAIEQLNN